MEIYERRRQRLLQLLAERFPGRGGRSALALRIERQPGYVSRCLNGQKRIGEAFARDVELRLHLPPFWLDGVRTDASPLSSQQRALLEAFEALDPARREAFLRAMHEAAAPT